MGRFLRRVLGGSGGRAKLAGELVAVVLAELLGSMVGESADGRSRARRHRGDDI